MTSRQLGGPQKDHSSLSSPPSHHLPIRHSVLTSVQHWPVNRYEAVLLKAFTPANRTITGRYAASTRWLAVMLVNQYSIYFIVKITHLLTILDWHFLPFSLTNIRRCQSLVQPRVPHRTTQTEKSCDTSFEGEIGVALQEIITRFISDFCHFVHHLKVTCIFSSSNRSGNLSCLVVLCFIRLYRLLAVCGISDVPVSLLPTRCFREIRYEIRGCELAR
jgi:hypothetical protein